MGRKEENQRFTCDNCGKQVLPIQKGSYRNHCPFCLYSKHVDTGIGDRASRCGGLMKPIRLTRKAGKGFQILHKCLKCGIERVNKIVEYDRQPDDIDKLTTLF